MRAREQEEECREKRTGGRERERERFLSSYTPRLYFRLLTRFPTFQDVRSAVSFPGPFISRVIIIRILRHGGCGYLEALVSVVAVAAPETDQPFDRKKISPFLPKSPSTDDSYGIVKMRYWQGVNPIDHLLQFQETVEYRGEEVKILRRIFSFVVSFLFLRVIMIKKWGLFVKEF